MCQFVSDAGLQFITGPLLPCRWQIDRIASINRDAGGSDRSADTQLNVAISRPTVKQLVYITVMNQLTLAMQFAREAKTNHQRKDRSDGQQ